MSQERLGVALEAVRVEVQGQVQVPARDQVRVEDHHQVLALRWSKGGKAGLARRAGRQREGGQGRQQAGRQAGRQAHTHKKREETVDEAGAR